MMGRQNNDQGPLFYEFCGEDTCACMSLPPFIRRSAKGSIDRPKKT
jgi:hypothetical protein